MFRFGTNDLYSNPKSCLTVLHSRTNCMKTFKLKTASKIFTMAACLSTTAFLLSSCGQPTASVAAKVNVQQENTPVAIQPFSVLQDSSPRASSVNACNAGSLAQIPGTDFFLGRIGVNLGPNGCTTNERYTSAVYKRTVRSNGRIDYNYSHKLLDIDQIINPSLTLSHSYDAYPFFINDKLYSVFECAVVEAGLGTSVNVCVAPVNEQTLTINPVEISVLVRETIENGQRLTAAVPKVLSHTSGTFLYWNTVKVGENGVFQEVTARGTEIFISSTNTIVDKDQNTQFKANDHTVVLQPVKNGSAEIYDVSLGKDGRVYALATLGDTGCTHPGSAVDDCYRLSIMSAAEPVSNNGFNSNFVSHDLPLHSHEYSRFSWLNDGKAVVSLQFVSNSNNSQAQTELNNTYGAYVLASNLIAPEKDRSDNTRALRISRKISVASNYRSVVGRLYIEILERTADEGGLQNYVGLMQNGYTEDQVRNDLMNSQEYKNLQQKKSTQPNYDEIVNQVYLETLNRNADQAGRDFYVGLMKNGYTTDQIKEDLMKSDEYKNLQKNNSTPQNYELIVRGLYLELLKREADPSGLNHFVSRMENGVTEDQIRSDFKNSQEYKNLENRAPASVDYTTIVKELYLEILQRSADPGGLNHYVSLMKNGYTEDQIRNDFKNSQEYKNLN